MKKVLLREAANFICWTRILGSVAVLVSGIFGIPANPFIAIIYSGLLISDLCDGYMYRHYASDNPPSHWFNRLSVTLDPIADLVFTICGAVYVAIGHGFSANGALIVVISIVIVAALFSLGIAQLPPHSIAQQLCVICLTYGCYIIMVTNTFFIWRLSSAIYRSGFSITMWLFYTVFFCLVPEDRYFRH